MAWVTYGLARALHGARADQRLHAHARKTLEALREEPIETHTRFRVADGNGNLDLAFARLLT